MSAYTDKMVAELQNNNPYNYDSAAQFAEKHSLSVRSVISKIKHLGLDYTARPVVKSSAGPRIRKADVVAEIATIIAVNVEALEGLAKADAASLNALREAVRSR